MQINLSPMRHEEEMHLARAGSVLLINGIPVDLAAGETSPWIIGTPAKDGSRWVVTLILPHGADAPPETLFPEPVTVTGDGPVPLPPYTAPPPRTDAQRPPRPVPAVPDRTVPIPPRAV
jgi:hypothetical protein